MRTDNRMRNGLIALAAVLVAGLVAVWFLRTYERVERVVHLPPRGEAGYNPLYALRQALSRDDVPAMSRQRLELSSHPLQPGDTVLLYTDPGVLRDADVDALLDWVDSGGHLLVRTPPMRRDDRLHARLLDELGVEPMEDTAPQCLDFQVESQEHHVEFCRGRRFRLIDVEPELSWGNVRDGYAYARLAFGEGHVDVLADFDFLANGEARSMLEALADASAPPRGGLRDVPHQALARQVLAPNYGRGTVHLIYAAQMPSLLQRLLREGWPVWAPLMLALLGWLWARAQRFGPQLPPPMPERRSLLEHVRAAGEHLFRYRRGVLLYSAVRQAFLARLRRRDPVAAALAGRAQVEAIAQRLAVPADPLQRALQTPASDDKVAFRDRIALLIQLRNRL